jgi:probable addiction module antidote protein
MTRKSRSSGDQSKMLIASFLNDALATDDTVAFVKAIGDLLRVQGMTNVSRKTGLDRSTLYVSFKGSMMPNIDRVIRALAALDVEIVVRPISRS